MYSLFQESVRAAWFAQNVLDGNFTGWWLSCDEQLYQQGLKVLQDYNLIITKEFVHHDLGHDAYMQLREQVEGFDSEVALVSCWKPGGLSVLVSLRRKLTTADSEN